MGGWGGTGVVGNDPLADCRQDRVVRLHAGRGTLGVAHCPRAHYTPDHVVDLGTETGNCVKGRGYVPSDGCHLHKPDHNPDSRGGESCSMVVGLSYDLHLGGVAVALVDKW